MHGSSRRHGSATGRGSLGPGLFLLLCAPLGTVQWFRSQGLLQQGGVARHHCHRHRLGRLAVRRAWCLHWRRHRGRCDCAGRRDRSPARICAGRAGTSSSGSAISSRATRSQTAGTSSPTRRWRTTVWLTGRTRPARLLMAVVIGRAAGCAVRVAVAWIHVPALDRARDAPVPMEPQRARRDWYGSTGRDRTRGGLTRRHVPRGRCRPDRWRAQQRRCQRYQANAADELCGVSGSVRRPRRGPCGHRRRRAGRGHDAVPILRRFVAGRGGIEGLLGALA